MFFCKHDWETKFSVAEPKTGNTLYATLHCKKCGKLKEIKPPSVPCVHDWEKISETIIPSQWEARVEALSKAGMCYHNEKELIPPSHTRTYVCVFKCKKCGELHETIVRG